MEFGKTTIFNILSGLLLPDTGSVFLESSDITGRTGFISYMQQKDLLLPYKTVLDNVALPLVINGMDKNVGAHICARARVRAPTA